MIDVHIWDILLHFCSNDCSLINVIFVSKMWCPRVLYYEVRHFAVHSVVPLQCPHPIASA